MSKRIPVYLSKEELEEIISWQTIYSCEGFSEEKDENLVKRLEEELATFEE